MRLNEMITNWRNSWLLNKFSPSSSLEMYREQDGEYAFWCEGVKGWNAHPKPLTCSLKFLLSCTFLITIISVYTKILNLCYPNTALIIILLTKCSHLHGLPNLLHFHLSTVHNMAGKTVKLTSYSVLAAGHVLMLPYPLHGILKFVSILYIDIWLNILNLVLDGGSTSVPPPDIWMWDSSMTLWTKPNLVGEAGDNACDPHKDVN